MQHHGIGCRVEAIDRAYRGAGCIRAMHARHRNRPLTRPAAIKRDHAAAVNTPRHLMLVLAGGDTSIAFNAAVGVAKKFHPGHNAISLRSLDLAERRLGLLHIRDRIVAIGSESVRAFTEHNGIEVGWVFWPQIRTLITTGRVAKHVGDALSDALCDMRRHS